MTKRNIDATMKRLLSVILSLVFITGAFSCSKQASSKQTDSIPENEDTSSVSLTDHEIEEARAAQIEYMKYNFSFPSFYIESPQISKDGSCKITDDIYRQFNDYADMIALQFIPNGEWFDFSKAKEDEAYAPGEILFLNAFYHFFQYNNNFPFLEAANDNCIAEEVFDIYAEKLFASQEEEYPLPLRRDYFKIAYYHPDLKMYSPYIFDGWLENRIFYKITDIKIREEESYVYYAIDADAYYLDLSFGYSPDKNMKTIFMEYGEYLKKNPDSDLILEDFIFEFLNTEKISKLDKSNKLSVELQTKINDFNSNRNIETKVVSYYTFYE